MLMIRSAIAFNSIVHSLYSFLTMKQKNILRGILWKHDIHYQTPFSLISILSGIFHLIEYSFSIQTIIFQLKSGVKTFEWLPVPQDGSNNRCTMNGWVWIHRPDHKLQLAFNLACHISCFADLHEDICLQT